MKLRSLVTVSLLAVILLVSCAPAAAPAPAEPEAPAQPAPPENEPPAPTQTVTQAEVAPTEAALAQAQPTEAPTEIPQPVATSRGPNLEATDPTTVSLNSGDLQFVEFFRFT
jgi:2-oxoglutarate dehydrogenase E2 component (dihydrolipoamide succinyltransferase)